MGTSQQVRLEAFRTSRVNINPCPSVEDNEPSAIANQDTFPQVPSQTQGPVVVRSPVVVRTFVGIRVPVATAWLLAPFRLGGV